MSFNLFKNNKNLLLIPALALMSLAANAQRHKTTAKADTTAIRPRTHKFTKVQPRKVEVLPDSVAVMNSPWRFSVSDGVALGKQEKYSGMSKGKYKQSAELGWAVNHTRQNDYVLWEAILGAENFSGPLQGEPIANSSESYEDGRVIAVRQDIYAGVKVTFPLGLKDQFKQQRAAIVFEWKGGVAFGDMQEANKSDKSDKFKMTGYTTNLYLGTEVNIFKNLYGFAGAWLGAEGLDGKDNFGFSHSNKVDNVTVRLDAGLALALGRQKNYHMEKTHPPKFQPYIIETFKPDTNAASRLEKPHPIKYDGRKIWIATDSSKLIRKSFDDWQIGVEAGYAPLVNGGESTNNMQRSQVYAAQIGYEYWSKGNKNRPHPLHIFPYLKAEMFKGPQQNDFTPQDRDDNHVNFDPRINHKADAVAGVTFMIPVDPANKVFMNFDVNAGLSKDEIYNQRSLVVIDNGLSGMLRFGAGAQYKASSFLDLKANFNIVAAGPQTTSGSGSGGPAVYALFGLNLHAKTKTKGHDAYHKVRMSQPGSSTGL